MSITALEMTPVAECRREVFTVLIEKAKEIRTMFRVEEQRSERSYANHVAACNEVLDELVALRAGRVEVQDELQLKLWEAA